MYKALEVAWATLQEARSMDIHMTNFHLQCLIYMAHGYFLGWKNKPLIDESIEAWHHGISIKSVQADFKKFKSGVIPVNKEVHIATDLDNDQDAIATIKGVLNLYGNIPTFTLIEKITINDPDSPWSEVIKNSIDETALVEISNTSIKNYFRKIIAGPKSDDDVYSI